MSSSTARRFVEQSVVTSLVPLLKRNLAKQPPPRHDAPFVRASVAAVFRWKEKEQRSLELLFVRRSVNEKDTWSGQVAFPGGRRQKKTKMDLNALDDVSGEWTDWESLRETAQRETMEEVGLDLTDPHVHWIGHLPPIQTHLRSLSVSTQVFFIDAAADEHDYKPKLQKSEIADVFWVDVQEFFNTKRYQVLSYPLEDSLVSLRLRPRVLALAKKMLGNMLFDCIYLPRQGHPPPDDERLPHREVLDFVLWGLTLRAVVNLFAAAGSPLPMRPDAQHFDSKLLGDIVLYCMRYPDKVIAAKKRMLQVDQEHVKQQLRQEQQTWEAEQVAAGRSDGLPLQFWSIGKLLRVLQASLLAADPLAVLTQHGISRHSVGSVDQRRETSQPIATETQQVPTADAVTYTSSRVWITGFLHFGEELDTCDTLHLCDSNSRLPSFLLDPSPQLVDQLVLIKDWVLVDKAFGGVRTANSMFLEMHDENPVALLPVNDLFAKWTQERVLKVLEANYQTKDPPMYTGTESWATVTSRLKENGVDNNAMVAGVRDELTTARKRKKQQRIHVVFGRVTSVSPISHQKDRVSSHFFVEIECHTGCSEFRTQSVANVMFTGVHSMRWHLFLNPGKIVLLTELVKVFSRECEMFLLQTMHERQNHSVESEIGALETLVLVWDDPVSHHKNSVQWIHDSTDMYSTQFVSRYTGKLLDYEGRVSPLLWDECIELQGPDETQVIVCLFHFPCTHELVRLRIGATVRVCDAHVLRWPTPVGGKLVIGLCPRSNFAVTSYGDPNGACITMGTRSRRGRSHKKWSSLGDFHRQSMVLSMWLLEVLELLDTKLFFGEDEKIQRRSSMLSFPRTRRRKAASLLAKKLCLSLGGGHKPAAMTLGALFLKCHSVDADNCITVQLPHCEKLLTCNRALTIRELQTFGESKFKQMIEARFDDVGKPTTSDGIQSIRVPAKVLDWCLVLGCIRGNIESGDLEIFDRTASVSLQLNGSEMTMNDNAERGLYLFRNFDFMIEDYSRDSDFQHEAEVPLVYCMSCSTDNVEYIAIRDDEPFSFSSEERVVADAHEAQEVVVVITHVDALPVSSIQLAGLVPEYRVLHSIVYPIGEGLQTDHFMKSVYAADILVNTQCVSWFVQKGGCYRIKVLRSENDDVLRPSRTSSEDRAVEASINYWNKSKVGDGSNFLCFDSLKHFQYQKGEQSINERRQFRVYRVESGQNSIAPLKIECGDVENVVCVAHETCKQSVTGAFTEKHIVSRSPIDITSSEYVAMNIITHFLQRSEEISQVCDFLHHPLTDRFHQFTDGTNDVVKTVDPDLHKPNLVSVVGIITKKKLYWKANQQKQARGNLVNVATIGMKRGREDVISTTEAPSRRLAYILHVRDLQKLDTVEIRIDASRFGLLGTLQLNSVVEFTKLQGFIARSSYKVYLNWSHLTAARLLDEKVCSSLPGEAELYGSMPTTFLNDLYHASNIDRMLHRYVVGVVHISYMLLKRKCGLCHQILQLNKRRGCWKHADLHAESKYSRDCVWSWKQLSPSDPAFSTQTYMGTTVRCIIDDGSGQAELFLENDITWELLMCNDGQRRRFEDILSYYVEELSYFSGRTANGSFATSKAEREQEYYHNELRAFVLNAIPSLRSLVVFAQRFYKAKEKEGTSVLTFGKDIHITTKTMPLPKLEAKRVDRVHVRSELQRRLAQLRLRS